MEFFSKMVVHCYGRAGGTTPFVQALLNSDCTAASIGNACPGAIGIPIRPMLAPTFHSKKRILSNISAIPITTEWCYDGERLQLHVQGDEVRAFGLDLQERTEKLGSELIASILKAVQGHNEGLIIDAIIQGLSKEKEDTDKVDTSHMSHENLDKLASLPQDMISPEIAALEAKLAALKRSKREAILNKGPRIIAFDLLWLGANSLMGYCLKSRREQLRTVFKESAPQVTLVRSRDFTADEHPNPEYIDTMMHEAVASGCVKGLLFKSLDSPYETGRRSGGWQILAKSTPTNK